MNPKPHHLTTSIPDLSDPLGDFLLDSMTIRRGLLDLLQCLEKIEVGDSKDISGLAHWTAANSLEHQHEVLLDFENQGVRYIVLRQLVHNSQAQSQTPLSPREREIADFIADGLSTKGIAVKLQISQWTVAEYVKRIFSKLGVNTRAQIAAAIARQQRFG
jgi:DNA-binding CsgD family transcriptional regulator